MQNSVYNTKAWVDNFYLADSHPFSEKRLNRISGMIPPDVETVLDIGIGNGYIYENLKGKYRYFGIDISLEMAGRLKDGNVSVGDVKELPFNDEGFDLVLAADLIEHINERFFAQSISEIKRVAKKYILITSPYKDAISWPVSLCNSCGREFNIYGHLRSIDIKLIKELFPQGRFDILKVETSDEKRDWRPRALVRIARKRGKVYSKEVAVCPYCFNKSAGCPRRNFFERLFGNAMNAMFLASDRLIPRWLKRGNQVFILLKKRKHEV